MHAIFYDGFSGLDTENAFTKGLDFSYYRRRGRNPAWFQKLL